jgi:hypothetical protein
MSNCQKLNTCDKINCILDKDILDSQYSDSISDRAVCSACPEKKIQKELSDDVIIVLRGWHYESVNPQNDGYTQGYYRESLRKVREELGKLI